MDVNDRSGKRNGHRSESMKSLQMRGLYPATATPFAQDPEYVKLASRIRSHLAPAGTPTGGKVE